MLEKTIEILASLQEKYGYTIDGEETKLIYPIKECRPIHLDHDINFLCEMHKAISISEIEKHVLNYKRNFPEELKVLYQYTNGVRLFARYISVAGLVDIDTLTRETKGKLPTHLSYLDNSANSQRARKFWGDGKLFFAWYNKSPHEYVYMDCTSSELIKPVHKTMAGKEEIIKSWDSFDSWFSSEYNFYMNKFENKQYRIEELGNGQIKYFNFDSTTH